MKKRHTEKQLIAILREAEVPGAQLAAVCRKHNISPHTLARWRGKFGGMEVRRPSPGGQVISRALPKGWRMVPAGSRQWQAPRAAAIHLYRLFLADPFRDRDDFTVRQAWFAPFAFGILRNRMRRRLNIARGISSCQQRTLAGQRPKAVKGRSM